MRTLWLYAILWYTAPVLAQPMTVEEQCGVVGLEVNPTSAYLAFKRDEAAWAEFLFRVGDGVYDDESEALKALRIKILRPETNPFDVKTFAESRARVAAYKSAQPDATEKAAAAVKGVMDTMRQKGYNPSPANLETMLEVLKAVGEHYVTLQIGWQDKAYKPEHLIVHFPDAVARGLRDILTAEVKDLDLSQLPEKYRAAAPAVIAEARGKLSAQAASFKLPLDP